MIPDVLAMLSNMTEAYTLMALYAITRRFQGMTERCQ